MIHIMLDLETWGTRPGCDIRSIGACVFDPVAGIINLPLGGWKNSDPGSKLFYVATDNPVITDPLFPTNPVREYKLKRDPLTVK